MYKRRPVGNVVTKILHGSAVTQTVLGGLDPKPVYEAPCRLA